MGRIGISDFQRFKVEGRCFTVLTAYDAPTARILEGREVPMLLVGDSLGNVILGHSDTVAVTMADMVHHCAAVRRGATSSFVVGDLPFLSYQVSVEEAVRNAGRLLQEGGVDAVKLEGGLSRVEAIRAIVAAGIPVVGHLGLTPQSATLLGGLRVQATSSAAAIELLEHALALQDAGAFAVVFECVPAEVAAEISPRLEIPTIGIGAGSGCDAQVLVTHDLLGYTGGHSPRFVRRYAEMETVIVDAVDRFQQDVRDGSYPQESESFAMDAEQLEQFQRALGERTGEQKQLER